MQLLADKFRYELDIQHQVLLCIQFSRHNHNDLNYRRVQTDLYAVEPIRISFKLPVYWYSRVLLCIQLIPEKKKSRYCSKPFRTMMG